MLLALASIAALVYGFSDNGFYVYSADIQGARYTSSEQVYEQSGLAGFSVFFIDPAVIRQRIETLGHVQTADVTVKLPAEVTIHIVEREPAILYQIQAQSYWVDAEGVVAPAAEERDGLIKLVDDAGSARLDDGHLDPAILQAVRHITQNLPLVTTFRYQEPYGLFFFSPEGWRVYLGGAERMDSKLAAWDAIRRRILTEKAPVQEVDLRYERPYWR